MSKLDGRASGPDFPCASLDEALRQLRRPPTPEAIRFKNPRRPVSRWASVRARGAA